MGRAQDGKRPGDLAFARAVVASVAANRGHVEPALEVVGHGRAAFAFIANGSPYTYAKNLAMPLICPAMVILPAVPAPRGLTVTRIARR